MNLVGRARAYLHQLAPHIQQREAAALIRDLAEGLDTALQLASVPERAQDDEWWRQYDLLCTGEPS
jgi:hypothetical protein